MVTEAGTMLYTIIIHAQVAHFKKKERGHTHKKKIMAMSCMEVKQNFSLTPTLIHKLIQILCLASSNPKVMDTLSSPPNAKKLKDACRTRWIQRIDSYTVFLELLPAVHILQSWEGLGTTLIYTLYLPGGGSSLALLL